MMNKYDMAEAVGMMRDVFVEESMKGSSQMKESIITKWSTIAASVCLVIAAALFAGHLANNYGLTPPEGTIGETDIYETDDTEASETEPGETEPHETEPTETESDTTEPEQKPDEDEFPDLDPAMFESRESIIKSDISVKYGRHGSSVLRERFMQWARCWAEAKYGKNSISAEYIINLESKISGKIEDPFKEGRVYSRFINVIMEDGETVRTVLYTVSGSSWNPESDMTNIDHLSGIEERSDMRSFSEMNYVLSYIREDPRYSAFDISEGADPDIDIEYDKRRFNAYDLYDIICSAGIEKFEDADPRDVYVDLYALNDYENDIISVYATTKIPGSDREWYDNGYIVRYNTKTGEVSAEPTDDLPVGKCEENEFAYTIRDSDDYQIVRNSSGSLCIKYKKTGDELTVYDGNLDGDPYNDRTDQKYVCSINVWKERLVVFNVEDCGKIFYMTFDLRTRKTTRHDDGKRMYGIIGDMLFYTDYADDKIWYTDLSAESAGTYHTCRFLSGEISEARGGMVFSTDGRYVAMTKETAENVYEICIHDIKGEKTTRATVTASYAWVDRFDGDKLVVYARSSYTGQMLLTLKPN